MSAEIVLEPAYVIHSRPYRETSLIVDFFTENAGRISAVAKGVRRPKSPLKSLLQPFNALLISVVGKRELKTLTHVEATTLGSLLRGKRLLAALYLNELIFRALPRFDPHLALFKVYADVLLVLRESDDPIEPQLRYFELKLLADLGYALSLDVQAHSDLPIKELSLIHI